MRGRAPIVVALLPVLFGLVQLGRAAGEPAGDHRWPVSPLSLCVSPSGDRLAFGLAGAYDEDMPLIVLDRDGRSVLSTRAPSGRVQDDAPLAWFPSGDRLLFGRASFAAGTDLKDRRSECLVLHVPDGRTEHVSNDDVGATTCLPVADDIVLSRVMQGKDEPVMYAYVKEDGRWSRRQFLPTTPQRQWDSCIWASRQQDGYRLMLKAERYRDGKFVASEFWSALWTPGKAPKLRQVASVPESAGRAAVSPDGARLATFVGSRLPWRLRLFDVASGAWKDVTCGPDADIPEFDASGNHLLIWSLGSLKGSHIYEGPVGDMEVVDTRTAQVTPIELPPPGQKWKVLGSAAWYAPGKLVLGVDDYGLFVYDLADGSVKSLWKPPAADVPAAGNAKEGT